MSAHVVVGERRFTLIKGGKEVRTFQMKTGGAFPSGRLIAYEELPQGVVDELYLLPDGRPAIVMYYDNECVISRHRFEYHKIVDQILFDRIAPGPD